MVNAKATVALEALRTKATQLNDAILQLGSTLPSVLRNFVYDLMNHTAIEAKEKADTTRKEYQQQKILFFQDKNSFENAQKRCADLQGQIMHYQARIHALTKDEDDLFMRIRNQHRDATEELKKSFESLTQSQLDLDVKRETLESHREDYYAAEHRSNQAHKALNKYFAIINALAMILWYLYNRKGNQKFHRMLEEVQSIKVKDDQIQNGLGEHVRKVEEQLQQVQKHLVQKQEVPRQSLSFRDIFQLSAFMVIFSFIFNFFR
jgi:uncharacterized coiled-coil DUF342 family protein